MSRHFGLYAKVKKSSEFCFTSSNVCKSVHSTLVRNHQYEDDAGFVCNCKIGFTKTSSGLCVPLIDECSSGVHDCDPNAFCYDKQHGYGCLCDDGYDGDGFACQFVDMCLTADCGEGFDCTNHRDCLLLISCFQSVLNFSDMFQV